MDSWTDVFSGAMVVSSIDVFPAPILKLSSWSDELLAAIVDVSVVVLLISPSDTLAEELLSFLLDSSSVKSINAYKHYGLHITVNTLSELEDAKKSINNIIK